MKRTTTPPPPSSREGEISYAQCWEDADVLLEALRIRPGASCLSIASGGDNTFSLLAAGAGRGVAIDRNPAQLACLEVRRAAYLELTHAEFLEFVGSRPSARRESLYRRCRPILPNDTRAFWDRRPDLVRTGIGGSGRFERFFALFRRRLLPFVHRRRRIAQLLEPRSLEDRKHFYESEWDSWPWRLLFRFYFSRRVMGRLGRYPGAFREVEGPIAERILKRARHAAVELEPNENPYLHWILTGRHGDALPHALRAENYERIRENLGALEVVQGSLEKFASNGHGTNFDAFNLSDVFEYISEPAYERLLRSLLGVARPGARFAYWNMLVPRERPASLASSLLSRADEARSLLARDKAFFYSQFVVEEVAKKGS